MVVENVARYFWNYITFMLLSNFLLLFPTYLLVGEDNQANFWPNVGYLLTCQLFTLFSLVQALTSAKKYCAGLLMWPPTCQ